MARTAVGLIARAAAAGPSFFNSKPDAAVLLLWRIGMENRRKVHRALVIEDDDSILRLVKDVLHREGFVVEGVKTGAAAIEVMSTVAYELLIIDLILPIISGEVLLEHIQQTRPKWLRRVIVTTASPQQLSCEFLQKICRLLVKPFDISQLILYARECTAMEEEAA